MSPGFLLFQGSNTGVEVFLILDHGLDGECYRVNVKKGKTDMSITTNGNSFRFHCVTEALYVLTFVDPMVSFVADDHPQRGSATTSSPCRVSESYSYICKETNLPITHPTLDKHLGHIQISGCKFREHRLQPKSCSYNNMMAQKCRLWRSLNNNKGLICYLAHRQYCRDSSVECRRRGMEKPT